MGADLHNAEVLASGRSRGAETDVQPGVENWTAFEHCTLAGVPVVTASCAELSGALVADCAMAGNSSRDLPARLVFDANGHALSLRETDPAYRRALDEADIVHADGGFLVTLSRWLCNRPIAERSATTDLIDHFADVAAEHGLTFYLLGATEAMNAEAARRLEARNPGLKIVGRHHGYFTDADAPRVVADIHAARPDIVWIGLGKPREQIFAQRWRNHFGACWAVTCGGCFDFVAGAHPRAPVWMQRANLEWLHRWINEPTRLSWRYVTTVPHALYLCLVKYGRSGAR